MPWPDVSFFWIAGWYTCIYNIYAFLVLAFLVLPDDPQAPDDRQATAAFNVWTVFSLVILFCVEEQKDVLDKFLPVWSEARAARAAGAAVAATDSKFILLAWRDFASDTVQRALLLVLVAFTTSFPRDIFNATIALLTVYAAWQAAQYLCVMLIPDHDQSCWVGVRQIIKFFFPFINIAHKGVFLHGMLHSGSVARCPITKSLIGPDNCQKLFDTVMYTAIIQLAFELLCQLFFWSYIDPDNNNFDMLRKCFKPVCQCCRRAWALPGPGR
jgi:hypothetical protein